MSNTPGTPTRLLVGSEHACGYLPGLRARSAFIDPRLHMHAALYGRLLEHGFRRSGAYVYRPLCRDCHACQPVRVPVAAFRPDRSQRRCLKHNEDLSLARVNDLGEEHFELYRRYLRARHPGGEMDPDDDKAFHEFFHAQWSQTLFVEMRHRDDQRLFGVIVLDHVPTGLSAVYSFFDPEHPARGLGTHAVLKAIHLTHAAGLSYLYLGYWVAGSQKMDYKCRFRPLELLGADGWRPLQD